MQVASTPVYARRRIYASSATVARCKMLLCETRKLSCTWYFATTISTIVHHTYAH